jgi:hypothetical protein
LNLRPLWRNLWSRVAPRRNLVVIENDSLPPTLPRRDIVLARDGDEDWCVGLRCPCGCKRAIELLVIPEARPRWEFSFDAQGYPTLWPSIQLTHGCHSHFWLRGGGFIGVRSTNRR